MNKTLCISIMLVSAALARENPFFSTAESSMSISSNKIQYKPPLTSMTYNFPDQARVLKEATFTFQNVDGSLETRKLVIDQSIDWHNPLVLSQYSAAKTAGTSITTNVSHADCGFMQFDHSGNRLSLLTKDPMLRSFSLSDPNSVVVDFTHTTLFNPCEKSFATSPYSKVKVTNHGKFARATITLDGRYACSVSKIEQGSSIVCK